VKALKKEGLSTEELFAELRIRNIEHLGQIRKIYLEFSGELSVFYFEDNDVKFGLSLFPEDLQNALKHIDAPGKYSCIQCGFTKDFMQPKAQPVCEICNGNKWGKSINSKRIT
jgi:uncharacterized membrane protein YcaP (DUF421 family)